MQVPVDVFRSEFGIAGNPAEETPAAATARANRRRLKVFGGVFATACIIGLAFALLRPPEYRAVARVIISPAEDVAPAPAVSPKADAAPAATTATSSRPVQIEAHVLTSRPLVQQVWSELSRTGGIAEDLGADPVGTLQSRLLVVPVPDTNLLELSAVGPQAETLAQLLNGLIPVYRVSQTTPFQGAPPEALDKLRDEARLQADAVRTRRAAVEAFRISHNIVSTERDENDILSRVKGQGVLLNQANDKVVAAEARLRSLRDAAAAGAGVSRNKDNPTLASLEHRAATLRETLRDMERRFTPAYMALDPDARAARERLASVEQQIVRERAASQEMSLVEAERELAGARDAADVLRRQIDGDRRSVGAFTTSFNQYKAMQAELNQLEGVQRATQERLLRMEASEQARAPG